MPTLSNEISYNGFSLYFRIYFSYKSFLTFSKKSLWLNSVTLFPFFDCIKLFKKNLIEDFFGEEKKGSE